MKIAVITRHSVPNYGSLLQSYATQKAIEKIGHSSEIINYTRYDERYKNLAKTLVKGKRWDKNVILRFIYNSIQTPNYSRMYKRFAKYRKNFLIETNIEYGNIKELEDNVPEADVYCSGSDQIWGRIGNSNYDEAYFLEFAKNKKCISYSSSFGKTELNEELNSKLESLLGKYHKILVREKSAVDILQAHNIRGAVQVLDPTLLISQMEWINLAESSKSKNMDKYVLVYQLHDNKNFNEYAKMFAKEKGLKLMRISPSLYHIFRSGKLVYLPDQYTFLKYFKDAQYVLTDSFHATVFSIIFNKKFIDILPSNKTGTRIESILNLFKIENRILKDYCDFESIEKDIDYDKVNEIIRNERNRSIELLKDAIDNAENDYYK